MNKKEEYIQFALKLLNYKSKQDLYEKLYMGALIDSYSRVSHTPDIENEIRDRFVWDLENHNESTKDLIQDGLLHLDFERSHFVTRDEKRRTDILFFITGFNNFTIECKRLFNQNSKNNEYISNGLERFINLKYSKENNYAAMVGFMVEDNLPFIHENVKQKVFSHQSIKTNSEFSKNKLQQWKLSIKSTHTRKDNSVIHIYHLLFDFSQHLATGNN